MAISRARKEELVNQYVGLLEKSDAIFVTDYTGMSVKDFQDLRDKLREVDGTLYVTKNTLLKIALERTGNPIPEELLNGQVATGFALGETPSMAKVLTKYADDKDEFSIRGGVFDGAILSESDVEALSKLPSLDELRATLLGLFNAPARGLASVVASGVRQVVNVLDAYAKKEEEAEASA